MFHSDDRLFSVCPMKVHHYGKTRHTLDRAMLEFYLWFLTCDRLSRSIAKKNAWSQNLYKRVVTGIKMIVGRILLASCVNNDTNNNHNLTFIKMLYTVFIASSQLPSKKKLTADEPCSCSITRLFLIFAGLMHTLYISPEANKLSHTHITLKNTFKNKRSLAGSQWKFLWLKKKSYRSKDRANMATRTLLHVRKAWIFTARSGCRIKSSCDTCFFFLQLFAGIIS